MATKITLIKKVGSNPKDKSKLYYAQVKTHTTKNYSNLEYEGSGLTEDTMNHAIGKLVKGIKAALTTGEGFKIDGLGTFKIKVKSKSAANAKDLTASDVSYNGIQFLVDKNLKETLEGLKFTFSGTTSSDEDEEETENTPSEENTEDEKKEVE